MTRRSGSLTKASRKEDPDLPPHGSPRWSTMPPVCWGDPMGRTRNPATAETTNMAKRSPRNSGCSRHQSSESASTVGLIKVATPEARITPTSMTRWRRRIDGWAEMEGRTKPALRGTAGFSFRRMASGRAEHLAVRRGASRVLRASTPSPPPGRLRPATAPGFQSESLQYGTPGNRR